MSKEVRASDPLKLELQTTVKHHGVLGSESGPLQEHQALLTAYHLSSLYFITFNFIFYYTTITIVYYYDCY